MVRAQYTAAFALEQVVFTSASLCQQEVVCNELRPGWVLKTPGLSCADHDDVTLASELFKTLPNASSGRFG